MDNTSIKKDVYVTLNKVRSHLMTFGDPFNSKSDVIICISGNPGIVDFYEEFGSSLYNSINLPVCIVGHAGHEESQDKTSTDWKNQKHLFDLQGQIQHKIDLINNCLDKQCKLHLIGHSIGSWIILEMLQNSKNMNERISSVNLLFPTIQRMAHSPNGVFLNNILRRLHIFVMILVTLFYIIPHPIKRNLVKYYLKFKTLPEYCQERTLKFLHPKVIEKVLFLAYNEMDYVKSLNNEILNNIKDKTYLLYSPKDGWAPVHYMDDLKQFQPSLLMQKVDVDHAFVFKSSDRIANLVSEFISTKI